MRFQNDSCAISSATSLLPFLITVQDRRPALPLSAGAGQYFHPAMHPFFRSLQIRLREELERIDFVHWIDRTMEILLISIRHGGVDAHAPFQPSVLPRPLPL